MKLTVDNKQRVATGLQFILEFYKILMGTFLVAFVPQDCGGQVCTIMDNINNTDTLHLSANICNAVTFFFVLHFYYKELQRENWCITYLDIDEEKPNNHLDDQIERYPIIKKEMSVLNKDYLRATYLALGSLIINFILSGVSISRDAIGTNSATSIISFFILVATKLSTAYSVGKKSVHDEHALSAFLKTNKTYNCIDEDHEHKVSSSNVVIEELDPTTETTTIESVAVTVVDENTDSNE